MESCITTRSTDETERLKIIQESRFWKILHVKNKYAVVQANI